MKSKEFTRDEFKAQCLLIGLALKEAPLMPLEDIAEKFTILHFGEKEYDEAKVAVRKILGLEPSSPEFIQPEVTIPEPTL